MASYLSKDEIKAVQVLHKRTPYLIGGDNLGVMSIARYYGGMRYNGCDYVYHPPTGECIRWDVFKTVAKMRKAANKERKAKNASAQMKLG